MPQDIELEIPFPPRINPGTWLAKVRNREWLASKGWLSEEGMARFDSWNLAELAGRFHPYALADGLLLGAQQQTFFFFFDDLFDSALGEDPAIAYELCHEMSGLARHDRSSADEPGFPLAKMFLEVWNCSQAGMSDAWRERAGRNWERHFLSYVPEAVNRRAGTVLSLGAYFELRRETIGTEGSLDNHERGALFEAPPELHESCCIREMRDLTAEVVFLTNDLHSLEKDEANGDFNNTVILLCLERRLSRAEAIEELRRMVRERMVLFHLLALEVTRLCGLLKLSPRQSAGVQRFVDGNRALMRGNYDWSRSTGRYGQEGAEQVHRSRRIEDPISRTPYDDRARGGRPERLAESRDGVAADGAGELLSTRGHDPFLRALPVEARG